MTNDELIELIDELRALPKETEWVEFKKGNVTKNDRLGLYISGLSNAACIRNQPYAYLVFGIEDETHAVFNSAYKFKSRKEGSQELELWVRRLLNPSISFQYYECQYSPNVTIEVFRIPAAKGQPTTFKNNAKIRIGSNLTDIDKYPDYIRTIYNSEIDWSAQIIKGATLKDLDSAAVKEARVKFKEKSSSKSFYKDIDSWDDLTFLNKAKITIDGQITNTAIILLGKPESSHLISPAVAQITWKLDTEEKAYQHFELPLFLTINEVLKQIRNVKYKFFPDNQLVATEVKKYDPESILEALNNCIAHQDYSQHARIILTEKVNKLVFTSVGSFYEGEAEEYSFGNKTPKKYRNRWLADAMVNLNMIDTLGYGIHKMYRSQRERFFPLPDYRKSTRDEVVLEMYGHTIDENYSKLLIEKKDDLDLTEVILLDKVQKGRGRDLTEDAVKKLRKKKLIEGRKPNYFISAKIAGITNQKAAYTKNKGLGKAVYQQFIIQHIENHGSANRTEINELLLDKLPEYMTLKQRKIKVNNLLRELADTKIKNVGSRTKPKWVLIKEIE